MTHVRERTRKSTHQFEVLLAALLMFMSLGGYSAAVAGGNASPSASPTPESQLETTVMEFITAIHSHGVDYAQANAFGPNAFPILKRLLADETQKAHWATTVTVIAFLDHPASFQELKRFLLEQFQGEVDSHTFRALLVIPSVLGTMSDQRVDIFLAERTDPARWSDVRWRVHNVSNSELRVLLSKVSINGLSYTGRALAGSTLRMLNERPYSPKQVDNIREALARHSEIQGRGFIEWNSNRTHGSK